MPMRELSSGRWSGERKGRGNGSERKKEKEKDRGKGMGREVGGSLGGVAKTDGQRATSEGAMGRASRGWKAIASQISNVVRPTNGRPDSMGKGGNHHDITLLNTNKRQDMHPVLPQLRASTSAMVGRKRSPRGILIPCRPIPLRANRLQFFSGCGYNLHFGCQSWPSTKSLPTQGGFSRVSG